ncbi:MAG TPA: patatin-like phospholipase family protein, partial [Actinomycetota bacterium]|nr:patatin-like phospholipase family protein [Actinomycetota bacterium]
MELLRRRRADATRPGARTDPFKVGLAVEGGGMRGVVSGGMLNAVEDLGLAGAVDAVYGCSSGAVNAAYFLMGNSWYWLSIYYDDLPGRSFLDFRRAARGRPVLA